MAPAPVGQRLAVLRESIRRMDRVLDAQSRAFEAQERRNETAFRFALWSLLAGVAVLGLILPRDWQGTATVLHWMMSLFALFFAGSLTTTTRLFLLVVSSGGQNKVGIGPSGDDLLEWTRQDAGDELALLGSLMVLARNQSRWNRERLAAMGRVRDRWATCSLLGLIPLLAALLLYILGSGIA